MYGLHFSTVYVRDARLADVRVALQGLMAEGDRLPTLERGLEPTPDPCTAYKRVRSFALMPDENGWIAVLEDGHPLDDGGVAEGISELLAVETLHVAYSDREGFWSYVRYLEGQPLEEGGADDEDYDVSAHGFFETNMLPHFGVYYEEVAAAATDAPSLAGSLAFEGAIHPRLPIGTEILTYARR